MIVTFLSVLTTDDPTAASQAVRFWIFAGHLPGRRSRRRQDERGPGASQGHVRPPGADRRRGPDRAPDREQADRRPETSTSSRSASSTTTPRDRGHRRRARPRKARGPRGGGRRAPRRARDPELLQGHPPTGPGDAPAPARPRGVRLDHPADVRGGARPDRTRTSRRASARDDLPERSEEPAVLDQLRVGPRCRARVRDRALAAPPPARAAGPHRPRQADPLPPDARRARRPGVRDAQVPLDEGRAGNAPNPSGRDPRGDRGRACPRRRRGRGPPDQAGHADAPNLARRAAPVPERPQGRHVARRPAPRAAGLRPPLRARGLPLRGSPPGPVGDHRLGPGQRPAGQDVARRPRRMGQLLHRELVPVAGREDHAPHLKAVFKDRAE